MSTPPNLQHRLQAILAADAVGYSRLMSLDDAGTLAALEAARAVFRACAQEHGGRVVDTAGDSVLVAFETATGAVQAAQVIQRRLQEQDASRAEDRKLPFRIGVHLGDVIVQPDGTLYGEGVNVAARLQSLAEPASILVSDAVRAAVRPEVAVLLHDAGEHRVKNIERPVRAFRVGAPGAVAAPAIDVSSPVAGFGGKPAIAVLPFDNMSNDPEQAHFADGIAEDILTRLAMWRWLPVIARNSSFVYRGRSVDLKQVGKELGARYILEGSVRRAGDRIRVTGQLIDTESGHHVWAGRFDRVLQDIFDLQDEVVEAIVAALEPAVGDAERRKGAQARHHDLGAWELFQKALWHYGQLTREGFAQAYRYGALAAEKDPSFASPMAYAAMAKLFSALFAWENPAQALPECAAHAAEALRRDPAEPLALAAHAAACAMGRHYDIAECAARKALDANPSFALGHYCCGWIVHLGGDFEGGLAHMRTALRLSPNDAWKPLILATLSSVHAMLDQPEAAHAAALLAVQEAPHYAMAYRSLATACALLGRDEEGRAALATFLQMAPYYDSAAARRTAPYRSDADFAKYMAGIRQLGFDR